MIELMSQLANLQLMQDRHEDDRGSSSEPSNSDIEHEAETAWETGKKLGLTAGVDAMAVQAIVEELVERKGNRRRKKRKGGCKTKKDGTIDQSGDISVPL